MDAMRRLTDKEIIAKLRRKGGKTAAEVGVSRHRLRVMERKGLIVESGRRPGGRGLPAVEFSLPPNGRKSSGTSGSRKRR